MTRFARYSASGIKKPPCEATPWSELAPTGSAGSSIMPSEQNTAELPPERQSAADAGVKSNQKRSGTSKRGKQMSQIDIGDGSSKMLKLKGKKLKASKANDKHTRGLRKIMKKMSIDSVSDTEKRDLKKALKKMSMRPGGGKERKKSKKSKREVPVAESDDLLSHLYAPDSSADNSPDRPKQKKQKKKKKLSRHIVDTSLDTDDTNAMHVEDDDNNWSTLPCPPSPLVLNNISSSSHKDHESDENNHNDKPETNHNVDTPRRKKKKKKDHHKKRNMLPPGARASAHSPVFAESRLMTQFDGYWVRRRAVPRLEKVRAELSAAISDPHTLKREMKKRKRAEHRLLLSALAAGGNKSAAETAEDFDPGTGTSASATHPLQTANNLKTKSKRLALCVDGPGSGDFTPVGLPTMAADSDSDTESKLFTPAGRQPASSGDAEERLVKFDGVWMTGDAVGRLKELRRKLKLQKVSDALLKQTMKTARRREEMSRKRELKKVCLGCRKSGHMIADCPQRKDTARAPITGLCFRCGSTEHRLQDCRHKASADGALPYAVCFVCGKSGHLSKECSLNPNGVYPKGGSCKICHQRSHLADDCPERKEEEQAASGPRLAMLGTGAGVEEDYEQDFRAGTEVGNETEHVVNSGPKPRSVKF